MASKVVTYNFQRTKRETLESQITIWCESLSCNLKTCESPKRKTLSGIYVEVVV